MAHQFFESAPHFRPYRWAGVALQIGLQPIRDQDWLIIDADYADFMHAKRAHLSACALRCYKTLPESRDAQRELRNMVVQHLVRDHAGQFSLSANTLTCTANAQSWNLDDDSVEPLWQLSQFVQEDFMLLQEFAGPQVISATANAYSSSGRLVAAVGRDIHWAHEPVPKLTAVHGSRIERILATVHENTPSARFNWQLTPLSSLFFPEDPHAANAAALKSVSAKLAQDPSLAPSLLNIRVERQTLRRLPVTRAVAFGIHTYSDSLSSLSDDSASLRALLALLREYPPERLRYTEMETIKGTIVTWLESQLAACQ